MFVAAQRVDADVELVPGAPRWNWVTYISVALSVTIGIAMFATIMPAMRVFPTADERVFIDPIASGSWKEMLKFIFGAHGDHRIPLQKAYQTVLLMWSGMDYSALIAANIPLMVGFSVLLSLLCLEYRGVSLVGDLLIPLLVLPFTASFLYIGFNVIFLHAVFLIALGSYFFVRFQREQRLVLLYLGLWSLLICATLGLPGAVFALFATVIIGPGLLYFDRSQRRPLIYASLAAIVAVSVLQAVLWAAFPHRPTASQPIGMLLSLYYNMTGSSLLRFARPGYEWKGGVIIALLVAALVVLAHAAYRRRLSFIDVVVAAPLFGTLAVMVTIAKGRGFEDWSLRFDHHYGYLTILIPIVSWLIISKQAPRLVANILGVGLVVFFGIAFKSNLDQRLVTLNAEGPIYRAAQKDFASTMSGADLVKKYPLLRYNDRHPQTYLDGIAREMDTLRAIGNWRYHDPAKP